MYIVSFRNTPSHTGNSLLQAPGIIYFETSQRAKTGRRTITVNLSIPNKFQSHPYLSAQLWDQAGHEPTVVVLAVELVVVALLVVVVVVHVEESAPLPRIYEGIGILQSERIGLVVVGCVKFSIVVYLETPKDKLEDSGRNVRSVALFTTAMMSP